MRKVRDYGHSFGENFRKLRKEMGVDMEYVSFVTGVPPSTLYSIEKGIADLTVGKAVKICEGLQVKLSDMIDETQPRKWRTLDTCPENVTVLLKECGNVYEGKLDGGVFMANFEFRGVFMRVKISPDAWMPKPGAEE